MNKSFSTNKKSGIGLIEVIVASSILAVILFAFTSSLSLYSQANADSMSRTQALFLAGEAIEVVHGLRDKGWVANIESVEDDTPYGISFNETNSTWSVVSSPDVTGNFTRTVTFNDVYRDADDNITEDTSKTFDPNTKLLDVEVSWEGLRGPQSVELKSIVANTFGF